MLWLVIKLSKEDSSWVKYPVEYIDVPEGMVIASVFPRHLLLDIDLRGADLVSQRFFRSHDPLIISIKDLPVLKEDTHDVIKVATASLVQEVEKQLEITHAVNKISPDTVYIGLFPKDPLQE